MRMKIINTAIDILLITVVFAVTDIVMRKVFCSEKLWLELVVYVLFYAVVFGAKSGILYLYKKHKQEK